MSVKKIALLGNQNSGKTTLFNALTGSNQYVGNWPGVTIDKVSGKISKKDWTVEDLPGLYSLSPYSPEEVVSRNFLIENNFDVIVNVLDAAHLERGLSLTCELLSFNKPMVIALNMIDKAQERNLEIDVKKLESILKVPVIPMCASKGSNIDDLLNAIENAKSKEQVSCFPQDIDAAIDEVIAIADLNKEANSSRFIATSLLQYDKLFIDEYVLGENKSVALAKSRSVIESKYNLDAESLIVKLRFDFIDNLVKECTKYTKPLKETLTSKIDDILTHKIFALPIFFGIVYVIYYLAVSTIGTMGTDYANDVIFGEYVTDFANEVLESSNAPEWLSGLVVDGIVGGVGAVLGFVPQMIVLFLLLSILEQCGYMTRVAFVLDRIFRHFGLSGRCFIPMVIATGCGVPALMASKSIDNINERRITLITTTFMPCSAKLPILAMISAAFFPESTLIAPSIYFIAIFSIAVTAIILKKDDAFNEEVSPFVLELPDYHMPTLGNVLRSTYLRCKAFVTKAGTIIFATVVMVWFLSSFNFTDEGFSMVEVDDSILAVFGSAVAFIFIPLGFATWQASVAIITGLLAKENVVGTLAVLLGLGEVAEDDATLGAALHGQFTISAAALSFLVFNLFSTPCIAALGAMKRQLASGKMFLFAMVYMLGWAYGISFVIYQLGGFIDGSLGFSIGTLVAIVLVLFVLYMVFKPRREPMRSLKIEAKILD